MWKQATCLTVLLLLSRHVDTNFLSAVFGRGALRRGIDDNGSAHNYFEVLGQLPLVRIVTGLGYISPEAAAAGLFPGSLGKAAQLVRLSKEERKVTEHRWPKTSVPFLLFPTFANNFLNLWLCDQWDNKEKGNSVPDLRNPGCQHAGLQLVLHALQQGGLTFEHHCHPTLWLAVMAALYTVQRAQHAARSCGMPDSWLPTTELVQAVQEFFTMQAGAAMVAQVGEVLLGPLSTTKLGEMEALLGVAVPVGKALYSRLADTVRTAGFKRLVCPVATAAFFKEQLAGAAPVEANYTVMVAKPVRGMEGSPDRLCPAARELAYELRTDLEGDQDYDSEVDYDCATDYDSAEDDTSDTDSEAPAPPQGTCTSCGVTASSSWRKRGSQCNSCYSKEYRAAKAAKAAVAAAAGEAPAPPQGTCTSCGGVAASSSRYKRGSQCDSCYNKEYRASWYNIISKRSK